MNVNCKSYFKKEKKNGGGFVWDDSKRVFGWSQIKIQCVAHIEIRVERVKQN